MKILMIGLGSIGQRHLRNIKSLFGSEHEILAYRTRRLQKTFSDNMQIREGVKLEDEYGIRVFTVLDEALREKPDIAFITTITSKHMEMALSCARAGCNLFIEKPLSTTIQGVDDLIKIAKEKSLTIFMGFQNRYHICIKEAKRILNEGIIGSVQFVFSEFSERLTTMHTYEDYRQTYMAQASMGGGPIFNLQIHDLDLLHFLLGEPIDVYSVISSSSGLEIDVEDESSAIFRFKNKNGDYFPAYTHTDFLQYPPVHTFKIVGDKGRIEIDLNKSSLLLIVDGQTVLETLYDNFKRNDMFIDELKDFFACINKKETPVIDLNQGIISMKMAIAEKKAAQERKCISMEEL